ncbi:MAG TPA: L,D-transpeptidase family protein [Kofleriaceae bacterium]|nr:L,D-transpeptidase family protein [Kofleriaceae bacterium]
MIGGWDDTAATLARFERDEHGAWRAVGAPWAAVIGRNGAAWGRGLHGDGAPKAASGPTKQEGDGRSPAGAFAIVASYGSAGATVAGAKLPYHALGEAWRCVDDGSSSHYNHVLDSTGLAVDWSSAENMHRPDALYTWVIEIAHNPGATPGGGSCIFFHVWGGPASTTAGCTAMPQPDIEAMLAWIDPAKHPAYVLLPRGEYSTRAAAWGLPPAP